MCYFGKTVMYLAVTNVKSRVQRLLSLTSAVKGRPFLCASSECAAMLPTIMEGEQEVEAH